MPTFELILQRLLPLYFLVGAGFFAGRVLHAKKETVASILIYIVVPLVIFSTVLTTPLSVNRLSLPLTYWLLGCAMCLLFFAVSKLIWSDARKNLVAFSAGDANSGYFGLPVVISILGEDVAGLAILCALGFILYENTLGFFITARGRHGIRESLQRVLRLPAAYAFAFAVAANFAGIPLNENLTELAKSLRGTYSVLGMMMIGLGVASLQEFRLDLKFIGMTFLAKFLAWPLVTFVLIALDRSYFQFFDARIHQVMVVLSAVPLAANTVAISTELRVEPEKVAIAVLLSTFFALFYIPIVVALFLQI